MRCIDWCKKDPNDERKINYVFTAWDGKKQFFTSEDEVTGLMIVRLQQARVQRIRLVGNEWYVQLEEIF